MHVPNFGGLSGSEDRGGGDDSIQFINFRGWLTKVLKNGDKKWGGGGGDGRVCDNNILTFRPTVVNKKCHVPVYFYTRLPIH